MFISEAVSSSRHASILCGSAQGSTIGYTTEEDEKKYLDGDRCCCLPSKNRPYRKDDNDDDSNVVNAVTEPSDPPRRGRPVRNVDFQPLRLTGAPHHRGSSSSSGGLTSARLMLPVSRMMSRFSRKRRSSLRGYRLMETACVLEYPMWVVPIQSVLAMSSVEPHQKLKQRGDLIIQHMADDTTRNPVIFISHQWLSVRHPDPEGNQLKVLQQALKRLIAGHEVRSTGVSSMLYRKDEVNRKWGKTLRNARIWYDYFSIPQITYDPECRADLLRAVQSIPAYVEMSSHTFILSPPIAHREFVDKTTGRPTMCDYYSWLERGWCLMEKMAQFLKVNSNSVVVIRSAKHMEFQDILDAVARKVGDANFACCALKHVEEVWVDAEDDDEEDEHEDKDCPRRKRQVLKKIPFACDKVKVCQLMKLLIQRRLFYEFHHPNGEIHIYRLLRALRIFLLSNLPHPQGYDPYEEERTVMDFMRSYHFTVDDVPHTNRNNHFKGWTPLRFAALSSNVAMVKLFIEQRADVNAPFTMHDHRWGIIEGCNILCHVAMYCVGTAGQECLSLLLDAKADVQSGGLDVLNSSCLLPKPCIVGKGNDGRIETPPSDVPSWGAEWALDHVAGRLLDLNVRSYAFSGAHCVLTACARSGNVQFMELLAAHGADFTMRFAHQADAFVVACSTCPASSIAMPQFCYELLRNQNVEVDLNRRLWLPFTVYWPTRALVRFGNRRSWLKSILLWHGATAMLAAAREGKCRVVAWLLEQKANPDLANVEGDTPLSVAKRFGFFNVVKVLRNHKKALQDYMEV
eukprot:GEMP01001881.1.p1 GENE.GEMP01001881.1~~GEMP01001881.1.p1  ORF type:complete len:798 (+),score=186.69 GEMP01001881.1:195-2588(+)